MTLLAFDEYANLQIFRDTAVEQQIIPGSLIEGWA
jgi:hypothetical protein